jgi:orotidine-5'-phosphate decarboxylase|tara:strand:- start:245 stop:937 length:693 start_codon:yes stop_codon:yes gene_type:complete
LNTNPIYCAIDTSSIDDALKLVKETAPYIGGVKLGLEFFTSCGIEGVETIAKSEIPLFLDLKLYDIPNTVKKSLKNILSLKPTYTTLHLSGGSDMLRECVNLKKELNSSTKLIGVTMLTSFNDNSMNEIGINKSINENVKKLSHLALNTGMDGIVCSPMEIKDVKNSFGSKLDVVVPGIRNQSDNLYDQKRTLSAKEAINHGADIIVIGRPITKANSPADAAKFFQQSIK